MRSRVPRGAPQARDPHRGCGALYKRGAAFAYEVPRRSRSARACASRPLVPELQRGIAKMSAGMPGERSVGELMGDLARESSDLIQKEIKLAKLETMEKLSEFKTGLGSMAVGGAIAFAGMFILLEAAALALDRVLQRPWMSWAIVGGATVLLGLIALLIGRRHVRAENLTPDRTMTSLRRDQQTIARHVGAG